MGGGENVVSYRVYVFSEPEIGGAGQAQPIKNDIAIDNTT